MSIAYSGIEWDYDNLDGIGYDSETLSEPYATWFYLITNAVNYEKETIDFDVSDSIEYDLIHHQKDSIINFNDSSLRLVKRFNEDSFGISEDFERGAINKETESVSFTENSIRTFVKSIKEDIAYLLDECRYIQYDSTTGTTNTVEQKELSGAISLFDVELKDGKWTDKDFVEWCESNCPVNYNELRPFIPGEYEYKNAYAGFRLSMPPTNGRFGVANSTVYIDVEDTVEKGSAEITNAEILLGNTTKKVYFSKRFYTSPQIMTSLLYATESSFIEIKSVSPEYFEFGFKSTISGDYVAGELTWLADGY